MLEFLKTAGCQPNFRQNTVAISTGGLKAFEADVSQCPDIAPILAVLASLAEGTSRITGAGRLRIKECDRLKAIAQELNKLGARVQEGEDSLLIVGQKQLAGGSVDSWGDHRIAMALAIASIRCKAPVHIHNSSVVAKSYPSFFEDFEKLGGNIYERNLG